MTEAIASDPPEELRFHQRTGRALKYNRLSAYANTKFFDMVNGGEGTSDGKTRKATIAALTGVAALTTVAEFGHKYGLPNYGNNFTVANFLAHSGRHFLVGYLGAALLKSKGRLNNWGGFLLAATVADVVTEVSEAGLVTGVIHDDPSAIAQIVSHSNLVHAGNSNEGDLAAALAGGVIHGVQAGPDRRLMQLKN